MAGLHVPLPVDCWLIDSVAPAASAIEGSGLIAVDAIPAGTVVARFGGRLVTNAEMAELIGRTSTYVDTLPVHADVDLVLAPDTDNHAGNHSCDPNTWWIDPFSTATRRDVAIGEELTIDYGTITDDADFSMSCNCGSSVCRRVVTGTDWRRSDLQARYGTHWVPVLRDRIAWPAR